MSDDYALHFVSESGVLELFLFAPSEGKASPSMLHSRERRNYLHSSL